MIWALLFVLHLAQAQESATSAPVVDPLLDKIESTRAGISDDERLQREALSHLFIINRNVKEIARKQEQLNQKLLAQEGHVRSLVQDVQALEQRKDQRKDMLNKRLRQLYQERDAGGFHWLFSAQSPVELERNHRFLRRMIDSDHREVKKYLGNLEELKRKRIELKGMVTHLAAMQKEVQVQERELAAQLNEKARYLAEVKKAKDNKISELKGLRHQTGTAVETYAFFERKGELHAPVSSPLAREYGTYVDPQFRFRLTHKGLFYAGAKEDVRAVFHGRVVFANKLPGLGRTVIVDHGDNYYSVYAFTSKIKVREGSTVREGDVLGQMGGTSPLFGPGLYFEIRHFTDAIDPRPWIKESLIKTADSRDGENL